jgi:ribosomal protein S18 acetylase RimI-like enzyme
MVEIRHFQPADYPEARRLWEATEGVGLSDADSADAIFRFLAHNPSLSFVAIEGSALAGTILCGHDGRRGLIHHLVVSPACRRQGLGRALVGRALAALADANIQKCHLLVFRDNASGRAFWEALGAEERVTLATYSMTTAAFGD